MLDRLMLPVLRPAAKGKRSVKRCLHYHTLGVIGVGMGRSRAQLQIWEIIASDFIRDTDYSENKTIPRSARTLSVGLSYNM